LAYSANAEEVRIDKLVHGGQGIGTLADGRKVFAWNALPGERVRLRLTKKKRDWAEGIVEEVLEPSPDRIEPVDEAYLSTSPWQIMSVPSENRAKKEILVETFERAGVSVPDFSFVAEGPTDQYRNKMEYSFWADDNGLHLALFHRASHGKQIIPGSSIARPEIDQAANQVVAILNKNGIRGSQLKAIVVRVNTKGETVAALFVKDSSFPKLSELENICQGLVVYFSNPKSPASVATKELYRFGDTTLTDPILGTPITYDVLSFFQVNLPIFEAALKQIDYQTGGSMQKVDMYSGVGTIGIPIGGTAKLIESDEQNIAMAKQNVGTAAIDVIHAASEKALEHIEQDACIIVDPPRAGLHTSVIERILDVKPKQIVYLSCNPATQARDLALLAGTYKITHFTGYNFFPRTPHIESLAILVPR
jgi:23S rRNA (uracil1939-C5)-methyltransferase